eukprot:25082-Eustigmatos_ZCMA.PRE.1
MNITEAEAKVRTRHALLHITVCPPLPQSSPVHHTALSMTFGVIDSIGDRPRPVRPGVAWHDYGPFVPVSLRRSGQPSAQ